MFIQKIDLFSSQFNFNVNEKHMKRSTLIGAFLSILVIIASLTYFVYVLKQYLTNQIEPNYRSQSLIADYQLDIPLSSDLIGFKFDYGNNYELENQKDKTYIVQLAFFYYLSKDQHKFIPLDIIDCTSPHLQGFKCLDFTKLSNYTLTLDSQINLQSQIQILTYGCRDIDELKKTVPDNCAEQSEIDKIVNGVNAGQRFKLYTSQYNPTTEVTQVSYRNIVVYTYSIQSIATILSTQIQTTTIKKGLIVQSSETFSSPISYDQVSQQVDRQYALSTGIGPFSIGMLQVEEVVQQIQIQYSTLPQILALVNSIFAFLMLIGIIGRYASQKSIQKDFFMLFLKTIYQDYYLKNLITFNFFNDQSEQELNLEKNQQKSEEKKRQEDEEVDEIYQKYDKPIFVPAFRNKFKNSVDLEQSNSITQAKNFTLKSIQQSNALTTQDQKEVVTEYISTQKPLNESKQEDNLDKILNLQQDSVIEKQGFNQDSPQGKDVINQFSCSQILNVTKSINRSNSSFFYSSQLRKNRQSEIQNQESNLILQKLKTIQDQNISNKIEDIIFKKKYFKKENQNKNQYKNNQTMKRVEQQIQKELNILNFVKDILFLKKAVLMMLSQEQLAALQVISCSQQFLDLNLNDNFESVKQLEQQHSLSHYEKSFALMENEKFQLAYLNDFLAKCQNNDNLSLLDLKIIQTLKKCHIN
ncbi:AMP-binding enzyme family protein (macronuclear) [Tetrahymena thermophila SB210]|uniref:AMP-binding enzyme family protein n=1 Tax=Tetrahymena thermophila (strain SB210) TaxID=312017 RepID=W7XKC7_TETTS|nr:AMP-binding enzyme family protein [Tetrahymena thermophila SB210]EWS74784.1 AMP-binding enzyme family protein [Tetrahymena thermophila SB210]|eukprot:XP_012652677.1 AMP-binding enzyme family protein [Tetrahymena thermophila SB210]